MALYSIPTSKRWGLSHPPYSKVLILLDETAKKRFINRCVGSENEMGGYSTCIKATTPNKTILTSHLCTYQLLRGNSSS